MRLSIFTANNLMVLALLSITTLASAEHCRKVDINKSSGYCTVPDPALTPERWMPRSHALPMAACIR